MSAATRNGQIDFWKALAIFGVVWIHSAFLIPFQPILLEWQTPVFKFCVPVFLVFWAYFAEKSAQKPGWTYRKSLSRGGSLLGKFVFWSAVYWVLHGDWSTGWMGQISKYWSGYGWSGQYFFVILLQAILVFPLVRWISKWVHPLVMVSGTFVVLVGANLAFAVPDVQAKIGDRIILYWVPYLAIGCQLASRKWVDLRIPGWIPVLTLGLISLNEDLLSNHLLKIGPYFLPSVFFCTVLIVFSASRSESEWLKKVPGLEAISQLLARYSMAIFCINPLVSILTRMLFPQIPTVSFWGAGWLMPLGNSVAVIGICILVAKALEKIKLAKLVAN